MFDQLINYFRDQTVLILGFGREGRSTYDFLRQHFPDQKLYIADQNVDLLAQNPDLAADSHLTCFLGTDYLAHFADCDLIMKSPGVSLKSLDTRNLRTKIKSQLELLLTFADFTTIGVTGTKGKSTTSSLIYQILQDQNIPSLLLGNIGTPFFEHLAELQPGKVAVLELSSHQLEYVEHSPHIAVLLNAYEEHLDFYRSFRDYVSAKCNIFKYQTSQDFLIYNADDEVLQDFVRSPRAETLRVSFTQSSAEVYLDHDQVYFAGTPIYDATNPRQLLGDYNLHNIIFALAVAKVLDLDLATAAQTVAEFRTLKHRLEFVGEFDGIKYYDNAIGTVPMATIEAVKALGGVETLIVGGMDRGVDQTPLIEFFHSGLVHRLICMPDTGRQIFSTLQDASWKNDVLMSLDYAEDLAAAVQLAKSITTHGGVCLLSPAAVSYGAFKNFEAKGDAFQQLVKAPSSE